MRQPNRAKIHFTREGVGAICGAKREYPALCFDYKAVTCRKCLRWLWDYAHTMYNWLEDRRPAGGF